MNHIRVYRPLVREQHEIPRTWLVALRVYGHEVLFRTRSSRAYDRFPRLGYEILQRLQPLFHLGIERPSFLRVGGGPVGGRQGGFHRAAEHPVKRVIVGRGDGVVLVVVATGAANGQSHQAARGHVYAVVENVVDVT